MKPYEWSDGHKEFFYNMHNALGLVQAMKLNPASEVLEVGCGPGWLTEILAMLGYRVTSLDPAPALLEIARHRIDHAAAHYMLPKIKDRVRLLSGTIEDLQFDEDYFDAIIFYDVLHHIVDEEKGFANCAKWLRPGGVLGVIEGAWLPGDAQQEATISEEMATYGTLENPFTQEYLDEVLRKAGFVEIERLIGVSGFYPVARQHETLAQNAVDPRVRNDLIARKASDGWTYSSDPKANTKVHLNVTLAQREGSQIKIAVSVENVGDSVLIGRTDRSGTIYLALRKGEPHSDGMVEAGNRVMLPRNIEPGGQIDIFATFTVPDHDFSGWTLDAVAEHIAWLSTKGSNAVLIEPD